MNRPSNEAGVVSHDPHNLAGYIRTIPDFPKPGVQFRDITTLWQNREASERAVRALIAPYVGQDIDKVSAPESRGFIYGGIIAHLIGAGFVPLRKEGKLPGPVVDVGYDLEYGTEKLAKHIGAVTEGERVLIHDDLLATGGTAEAAAHLIRGVGATVIGASFIVSLPDLGGAQRLEDLGVPVFSLVEFSGE